MSAKKNSRKKSSGPGSSSRHPARSRKPEHFAPNRPARVSWISGARLRTLPLAIAPVAIGAGAAHVADHFSWVLTILCLVVTLSLQIGVNYANDYSDGVRGTDAHRVGPGRLTGSGSATPRSVLVVALAFFALSLAAGLAVTIITQMWWLPAVLHRRKAPVRIHGPGRAGSLCLLWARGHGWHHVRSGRRSF